MNDKPDGRVEFLFGNSGNAVISEVYFDDGSLLGLSEVKNYTGVLFVKGADPGDLPGGENAAPPFNVTAGFLAEADGAQGGVSAHGVGLNEQLGLLFTLKNSQTYANVLDDLRTGRFVLDSTSSVSRLTAKATASSTFLLFLHLFRWLES